MGATRPHNPAARGELLGAPARGKIEANRRKTKPTLNTKLRILPKKLVADQALDMMVLKELLGKKS